MAEAIVQQQKPILALVSDLFFTLKIGDTAKALGLPIQFAASPQEFLEGLRRTCPRLVIADLTIGGADIAALFEHLAADAQQAPVPVLGYTTHADWKRTRPLHHRCTKVVTKETLARNLAELIQQLIQPG
jgi:CheY-like chemotaxis protein